MKKTSNKRCPKCRNKLVERVTMYTKDVAPDSAIVGIDVTGKKLADLHSCTASGCAWKTRETDIAEFLNNTTGISLIEKKLICNKCGFSIEVSN